MASYGEPKKVSTPNARLFATEGSTEGPVRQRKVKNYMKSSIFDEPVPVPTIHRPGSSGGSSEVDSASDTSSNDGDRAHLDAPHHAVPIMSPAPSSMPTAGQSPARDLDQSPRPKGRVPPGGYAHQLW